MTIQQYVRMFARAQVEMMNSINIIDPAAARELIEEIVATTMARVPLYARGWQVFTLTEQARVNRRRCPDCKVERAANRECRDCGGETCLMCIARAKHVCVFHPKL